MSIYKENTYYLEERTDTDISPLWQWIQVFFYVCCIGSGFTVGYCFSNTINLMDLNCILYAKVESYQRMSGNGSLTKQMLLLNSDFRKFECNLVIYVPVLIATYASFFMVLFIICGRGGAGNQIPGAWRIVFPAIVFNFICFCLSVLSTYEFHWGLKVFLEHLATVLGRSHLDLVEIRDFNLQEINVGEQLVKHLLYTKHALWTLVSFWGLNFCWIFLRCIFNVDFQLVRTTIRLYPKSSDLVIGYGNENLDKSSEANLATPDQTSDEILHPPLRDNTTRLRTVHFIPSVVGISTKRKSVDDPATPDPISTNRKSVDDPATRDPNSYEPNELLDESVFNGSTDSSKYFSLSTGSEEATKSQNQT